MAEIGWRLYADATRSVPLAQGVFPVQWIRGDDDQCDGESRTVQVSTLHPQIVREIQREAVKLVENGGQGVQETAFPVKRSALALPTTAESKADDVVHCVLTLKGSRNVVEAQKGSSLYGSWLEVKLHRAEFHRQRGNERFKRDEIQAAVRAYKKALQYLACPSTRCSFSQDEREKIKTVAVPCHTNLATCHWKLGRMDACIRHSTQVLALDPSHTKARYRRSQAYLHTKQFDEAVDDLTQAITTEPDSKLFRTSLDKAKLSRQQHLHKTKQALAAAFTA